MNDPRGVPSPTRLGTDADWSKVYGLSDYSVLRNYALRKKSLYRFHFAVDNNKNNKFDATFKNSVTINVK